MTRAIEALLAIALHRTTEVRTDRAEGSNTRLLWRDGIIGLANHPRPANHLFRVVNPGVLATPADRDECRFTDAQIVELGDALLDGTRRTASAKRSRDEADSGYCDD